VRKEEHMEPKTLDYETGQELEIDSKPAKSSDPDGRRVLARKPFNRKLAIFGALFVIIALLWVWWTH